MQKIKILFLITDLGKGGAERYLIDLCNELENYNHIEYRIGSLFNNNQNEEFTENFPVIYLDYSTFSLIRKNENPKLKNLIEEFKPNIIHSHRYLGEFITSYYVDKKIKYVCHGHDNMIQLNNFSINTLLSKNKLLNFIEKQYLTYKKYKKVTTYFIANSTHTLNYYQKALPKKTANKVKLIQYGFNFNLFQNNKNRTINSSNHIKLINVGSFQNKKNQTFLVDVAKELKQRGVEFKLSLIGDGQNRNKIIEKVNQLQLEDVVELPGIIHNVQDLYNSSDIYVHSAYYEPFGLVFLEAMAAGLPVVTLNGQGNKDIIEEGKNGFMLASEDVSQFADYIIQLVESPKIYLEISEFAKEYAKSFDIKTKTEQLVNFYESILN